MSDRGNVTISRNELLIMIDYLLNKTDEEHLSRVKEIIEYAKNNYGVKIHKTRVSECLEYLKEINDKYPDRFPFIIHESHGLQNKKYFIARRQFSIEDIYYICSAIKNDKYTGKDESRRLINAILDSLTNERTGCMIRNALDNKFKDVHHYSDAVAKLVHKLDSAKVGKNIISFNTISKQKFVLGTKPICQTNFNIPHRGYVYNVVDYDRGAVLIFINLDSGALEQYEVKKIKNLKVEEIYKTKKENEKFCVDSVFQSDDYESPKAALEKITIPEMNSKKCTAEFSFLLREVNLEAISESFKAFFHKDLVYKTETTDNGRPMAKCSISTNTISFVKWVSNYEIFTNIAIKGDNTLKEFCKKHFQSMVDRLENNIKDS